MKHFKSTVTAVAVGAAMMLCAPAWADANSDLAAAETEFQAGNYDATFKLIEPLAEAGNAEAQRSLAVLYGTGLGVAKDLTEALKWMTASAEQGLAAAQYQLGVIYANGEGVDKSLDQARLWMKKAADGGVLEAERFLGLDAVNSGDIDGGIDRLAATADKGSVIAMLDLAQNLKDRASKSVAGSKTALSDLETAYMWVYVALPVVPSGEGRDQVHRLRIEVENLYKERDSSGADRVFTRAKTAADDKIKELRAAAADSANAQAESR